MRLEAILEAVQLAFTEAPAWSDPNVRPKAKHVMVNKRAVPSGTVSWPPADPFYVSAALQTELDAETARRRWYEPMGRALAQVAKSRGASAPGQVALSIKAGPAFNDRPTVTVTAEPT